MMSVTRRELCSMVAMLSASVLPATALDAARCREGQRPTVPATARISWRNWDRSI
jgi:hypothetical protein